MKFLKSIYNALIEYQERRAACFTARYLVQHNDDFRSWSVYDLCQAILNKEFPVSAANQPIK